MLRNISLFALVLLLLSCSNPKQQKTAGVDYEAVVRTTVSEFQRSLPQNIGNGITMKQMYLKNKDVVYEYEIDETENGMMLASYDEVRMKGDIVASMKNLPSDAQKSFREFLRAICETGRDLVYLYVGSSSHTEWRVVFSKEELEKI